MAAGGPVRGACSHDVTSGRAAPAGRPRALPHGGGCGGGGRRRRRRHRLLGARSLERSHQRVPAGGAGQPRPPRLRAAEQEEDHAHLHLAPGRRDAARAQLLRQHEEDPAAAAAGDVLHREEVRTAAAATKTDGKRPALGGVTPMCVGAQETDPALLMRVSAGRSSVPLH